MAYKDQYSPEAWTRKLEKEKIRKRERRAVSREVDHDYYKRSMADPERRAELAQKAVEWRAENREVSQERSRKYMREVSPELRKQWSDAERKRKKGTVQGWLQAACCNANRRALRMGREGRLEWRELLDLFEERGSCCQDCGSTGRGRDGVHVGHAMPLFYEASTNTIANIIFQCRKCNAKQHNAVHHSAGTWKLVRVS